jgi:hypothetical protein
VSLIAALAGGLLCFVGPIVAIVFGHIARSRIKRSGASGSGMALAGVIIGYIEVALGVAVTVLIIVVAVYTSGDATGSARRLASQIQIVAGETRSSPRDTDVIRRAIRAAGLADDKVLVGATGEFAVVATTDDLATAGWELEVHDGRFGRACMYLPPTSNDVPHVRDGECGPTY